MIGVLDNFNDYENNGSITAKVFEDGQDLSSMGDMIAAFVGSEQRGVASTYELPPFWRWLCIFNDGLFK